MVPLVISEIGVNHNVSLDMALKLIEEAANCGASAVKFQSFSAEGVNAKCAQGRLSKINYRY